LNDRISDKIRNCKDKVRKYKYRNKLRYYSKKKQSFCFKVILQYSNRNIKEKGKEIPKSEEYPHKRKRFELKREKIYGRKMKQHRRKTQKTHSNMEIHPPITTKSSFD